MDEYLITETMEEPPGGHNHGRKRAIPADQWEHPNQKEWVSLDTETRHATDLIRAGATHVIGVGHGGTKGNPGGVAVHPDVYVDESVLRDKVEKAFGFTVDQIQSVYTRAARHDAALMALRDKVDARLLAIYRAGGNMRLLAEKIGVNYKTVNRAVERAAGVEAE